MLPPGGYVVNFLLEKVRSQRNTEEERQLNGYLRELHINRSSIKS